MTNKEMIAAFHAALESGKRTEAVALCQRIDWILAAAQCSPPPKEVDTRAADAATLLTGRRDIEGAILRRQERFHQMQTM